MVEKTDEINTLKARAYDKIVNLEALKTEAKKLNNEINNLSEQIKKLERKKDAV